MSNDLGQLSADEIAMIQSHREKKLLQERALTAQLHLIRSAADYLEWLTDNGRGSTFSTFWGEFRYGDKALETYDLTGNDQYKMVGDIIAASYDSLRKISAFSQLPPSFPDY